MSASMPLAQLKRTLKDRVAEDIALVLQDLKQLVRVPDTYNRLIELEARLKAANRDIHSGTLSFEQRELLYPRLRKDVLAFIDSLSEADLQSAGEHRSDKKANRGSILYRIPSVMQLHRETRCMVRLAYLEEYLLEDLEKDEDTTIKSIRVSEVMGVQLQDPSEQAAFSIRALTQHEGDGMGFLDEDDYTEWLFAVKPIREGVHPLMLKVMVVEEKRGRERKREIVLEENIEIVAVAPATDEIFKTSPHSLAKVAQGNARGAVSFDTPKPRPTIPTPFTGIRRMAGALVFLLITSVTTYAVNPRYVDWQIAKTINSEERYENFIGKYKEKGELYIEDATYNKAIVADKAEDYEEYLDQYESEVRVDTLMRRYADKVLQVARSQSNIEPLTAFVKKYEYTPTFTANAKASVLKVAESTTNAEQLQAALVVFDGKVANSQPDPAFSQQLQAAIAEIQAIETAKASNDVESLEQLKAELPEGERKAVVIAHLEKLNVPNTPPEIEEDTEEVQEVEEAEIKVNKTETPEPKAQEKEQPEEQTKTKTPQQEAEKPETETEQVAISTELPKEPTETDEATTATEEEKATETPPETETKQEANPAIPVPEMVFVQGGTFTMGCLDGRDENCLGSEKPAHEVTLSDFYIGKYEVTNEQYCAFLNEKGNQEEGGTTWVDLSRKYERTECAIKGIDGKYSVKKGHKRLPMVYVSWYGARAYAKWLSEKTGKTYQIPTEAQWEYAARGGMKSKGYQYAGSKDINAVTWYNRYSNGKIHIIGQKDPNELGVYDMSGNVKEWCNDWDGEYSVGAEKNPEGALKGRLKVLRGGDYKGIYLRDFRSSNRSSLVPHSRLEHNGFRLARI